MRNAHKFKFYVQVIFIASPLLLSFASLCISACQKGHISGYWHVHLHTQMRSALSVHLLRPSKKNKNGIEC
jgi:hypothetical protein